MVYINLLTLVVFISIRGINLLTLVIFTSYSDNSRGIINPHTILEFISTHSRIYISSWYLFASCTTLVYEAEGRGPFGAMQASPAIF